MGSMHAHKDGPSSAASSTVGKHDCMFSSSLLSLRPHSWVFTFSVTGDEVNYIPQRLFFSMANHTISYTVIHLSPYRTPPRTAWNC